MILLLSFGVYDTAFTQILLVNVYPSGIHVALSGWVGTGSLEWLVKKERP